VEPERNIEKELKAYAQQRRAASGAPAELHPAKRRLLQEEASRLSKAPSGATPSWWQIFLSSWPRFATTGFAVVALLALIWLLLPATKSKREGFHPAMELARNRAESLKEMPAFKKSTPPPVATPAAPQDAPVMVPTLAAKDPARSTPAASDGSNTRRLYAAATPPPAGTSGVARSPLLSEKAAPSNTAAFALSDTEVVLPPAAPPGRSALAGSLRNYDTLDSLDAPIAPVIQPFQRTDFPQNADKTASLGGASNVLFSFRVEQTRDKLRMIDGDGSVYNGFVARIPETPMQPAVASQKAVEEEAVKSSTFGGRQTQPVRLYRFRVAGTNRTLNEEVVFTGNFLTSASSLSPQQPAPFNGPLTLSGNAAPAATNATVPLELQKARVEGRLLLGKTNKILINALPAKP
jgi:hypothetical protein